MWEFMDETHPSVFVHNYEDGINRVKEGDYAFLMESTMLDYVVQVKLFTKNLSTKCKGLNHLDIITYFCTSFT
jgi:hypothetical protein